MKTSNRIAFAAAIFLIAIAAGLALSRYRRPGGDSTEMLSIVAGFSGYYFRSPMTVWLHQAVFKAIGPFGGGPEQAIAFCSAAAGGVYLLALLSISCHPLFLLFNLLAGTTFLFFGHIENYAWVNALLVVYLALIKRAFEDGAPLWPAAAILFLACLFHMLAVFTLPTLALAIWRWNPERRRLDRRISDRDWQNILLAFVATVLFVAICPMLMQTAGLDNNTERLVPLFHTANPRYFFTMFSFDHLRMLGHFHWMASPLGLPVLLVLGWRIRGRYQTLLLAAAVCGLFWTTVWHPDMGKSDWDLFSSFAFPLDVLDGLLLAGVWDSLRRGAKKPAASERGIA